MISIRRRTVLVMLLLALGVGAAGGWAVSQAQSDKTPAASAPTFVGSEGARVVPAALDSLANSIAATGASNNSPKPAIDQPADY